MASDFWHDLTKRCGRLSEPERNLMTLTGYQEEYDGALSEHERGATVEIAAERIESNRAAGYWPGPLRIASPEDGRGKADGRWALLRDLTLARGASTTEPLLIEGRATHMVLGDPLQTHDRVIVSFDSRLSRKALFRELVRIWPDLRAAGWVRPTRPLGDRKLALVRFVCLEAAELAWPDRLKEWNRQHPAEQYADLGRFISAFRGAEKSLTGRAYGLDWYYDPEARWLAEHDDWPVIQAAMERGEISAEAVVRYVKRMAKPTPAEAKNKGGDQQ